MDLALYKYIIMIIMIIFTIIIITIIITIIIIIIIIITIIRYHQFKGKGKVTYTRVSICIAWLYNNYSMK